MLRFNVYDPLLHVTSERLFCVYFTYDFMMMIIMSSVAAGYEIMYEVHH